MPKNTAQPSLLVAHFQKKHEESKKLFAETHKQAQEFLAEKGVSLETIRDHSTKLLAGATLGSALLLTSPKIPLIAPFELSHAVKLHDSLSSFLSSIKGISSDSLNTQSEEEMSANIKRLYGVDVAFELDQNRLPDYTGVMAQEQHLYRSATDTLAAHSAYQEAGMAPARGAFGYFADGEKTWEVAIEQEKYYIVLQTFLIPEWNQNWATLKPWYAFRKFMVINPQNGKAVIAVLGDSGPGVSTGKQFGGSPEVMASLGLYPEFKKGEVLVVFLDDPGNSVPLGPVAAKEE